MAADDMEDAIVGIRDEVVNEIVDQYFPSGSIEEQWDAPGLTQALERDFNVNYDAAFQLKKDENLGEADVREQVVALVQKEYERKVEEIGAPVMREFEKVIMLQQLDSHWKEHLAAMDYLRQGIGLRGYAQKNPKQEYKREAFEMFGVMLDQVKHDAISILSKVQIRNERDVEAVEEQRSDMSSMRYQHAQASALPQAPQGPPPPQQGMPGLPGGGAPPPPEAAPATPFVRSQPKVGRNEPCPCGSGKKYKQCHGRLS